MKVLHGLAALTTALMLAGCVGLRLSEPPPNVSAPAPPPAIAAPAVRPPAAAPPAIARRPTRSCLPRGLGAAPHYPDSDTALRNAAGAADRYQLMAAGRLMRQRRLDELERAVAACR